MEMLKAEGKGTPDREGKLGDQKSENQVKKKVMDVGTGRMSRSRRRSRSRCRWQRARE